MSVSLVQYIIIRSDLHRTLQWPMGALLAQACHATAAVTHLFRDDPVAKEYLADLDNMHKIVLDAPNEDALKKLDEVLTTNQILHKLWIEQPENIPTCIVVKPYPRDEVKSYFKKLKLLKDL